MTSQNQNPSDTASERVDENPPRVERRGYLKKHSDPAWLTQRLEWGWTRQDMADDAGVTTWTIRDHLRAHNLPVPMLDDAALRPCDLDTANCQALCDIGARAQDFAGWLGTSRANVHRMFDIAGVRLAGRQPMKSTNRPAEGVSYTPEDFVVEYWEKGRSLKEIGADWGIAVTNLSVLADGWGIPRRVGGRTSRSDETCTGE